MWGGHIFKIELGFCDCDIEMSTHISWFVSEYLLLSKKEKERERKCV